jgi:hypothetical protein
MSDANVFRVLGSVWTLLAANPLALAGEATPAACFEDEVLLHVRTQFAIYGPRSSQYEYFGFIYRKDGRVDSAVTHDFGCRGQTECVVNTGFALKRIPKGAKVLGEWHTHPHFHGSDALSMEDVRGAQANRHIRCYTAFYSSPDGDIYRWNLDAPTVAAAMASRTRLGNYRAVSRAGLRYELMGSPSMVSDCRSATFSRRPPSQSPPRKIKRLSGRASATETRTGASNAWGDGYQYEVGIGEARCRSVLQGSLRPVGVLHCY